MPAFAADHPVFVVHVGPFVAVKSSPRALQATTELGTPLMHEVEQQVKALVVGWTRRKDIKTRRVVTRRAIVCERA